MSDVWYHNYETYKARIDELRGALAHRCGDLQIDLSKILKEFSHESLARAVYESNWQEGIELDRGKTQKLEMIAFDEVEDIIGPHLDMLKLLRFHRDSVVKMKRDGATQEEIGAYNLARAYHAVEWVGSDLATRFGAGLVKLLKQVQPLFSQFQEAVVNKAAKQLSSEELEVVQRGFAIVENLERDKSPMWIPMTAPPTDQADMLQRLLTLNLDELIHPMKTAYIHFFHRLVLMGIMPGQQCGRYRKRPVHVGNPDLYFPTSSAVPQLMREFCLNFPAVLGGHAKYDPILMAAKASHKFVAIHPYEDGNGRVSRLLMNLVLWGHHPPVALKADKKGRHRYGQALRKADRGDITALAALIALSIVEMYENLLHSLGSSRN